MKTALPNLNQQAKISEAISYRGLKNGIRSIRLQNLSRNS